MSWVGPDAPPFFVIHGANDTLVPVEQARSFVAMLRAESKNPVAYAELPGAQHAFEIFDSPRTLLHRRRGRTGSSRPSGPATGHTARRAPAADAGLGADPGSERDAARRWRPARRRARGPASAACPGGRRWGRCRRCRRRASR